MKKTILATSILMACSMGSYAATEFEWVDPNEDVKNYQFEDMAGANSPIIKSEQLTEVDGKLIFDKKANHITTGSKGNALLAATSNDQTIVNKGSIWVTGTGNGDGMVNNYGTSATLVNQGRIYVDGVSADKNKGMTVNPGGKAINDNVIIVKNKASGILDASGAGKKAMVNNGTIAVVGNGIGINFRNEGGDDVTVQNNGDVIVTGSGIGVKLAFSTKDGQKEFTNTGVISATGEGARAIYDGDGSIINLTEESQIIGLVDLHKKTVLNFQSLSNDQKLALVDEVGTINVDAKSHVIIEQGTEKGLRIGELNGRAAFLLHHASDQEGGALTVETLGDKSDASVTYSGAVGDELLSGTTAQELLDGVQIGGKTADEVAVQAGAWGDAMNIVNNNGKAEVHVTETNSLLTSAQDVAVASALMWRDQLSSLSDRMGTLRTMPSEVGSWARYTNGRLDGNDITHDFNTLEVGFDKKIAANVALGASFSYTKADTDVVAGSADNNTYTGGLYATYMNDSNCFVDAMLKIGRIDAEYDLLNDTTKEHADYMMTGTIFGIETGHRWTMSNFYVEPAVQLTYSYLRPESYETNIRHVKYQEMESLIARVGVTSGMTFAEKGAAYVGVSYNHDFMGEVKGSYSAANIERTFEDQLDENWGEAKVGASYQVTNGLNAYADVATSFGGDIDQKWRVNVGARYVF